MVDFVMAKIFQTAWMTFVILGAARIVANELHEMRIALEEALFPGSER